VRRLWFVLGIAMLGGGLAVMLTAHADPTDYGWFVDTPMEDDADWHLRWDDAGSVVVVSARQLIGGGIAGLGLLVLACGAGVLLGRRGRSIAADS